jgi:xylem cysteine proteinase
MDTAFKYSTTNGLETEEEYSYSGKPGTCHADPKLGDKISSYKDVKPRNRDAMKAALVQQPVSVAIEADTMVFQMYSGGVITRGCGTKLDHGVLAVGYGVEGRQEYILLKNSWGPSWGVNGYVKVSSNNGCGVLEAPSYPIA